MAQGNKVVRYKNTHNGSRPLYVYGNTVRQPEILPKRRKVAQPKRPVRVSAQVRKNRNRATAMNKAYVSFLITAAVCVVVAFMLYLKLQADVVNGAETITSMQRELENITEKNNTDYHEVYEHVDLQKIKAKAVDEMGMVYASEGNVIEYDCPAGSFVKQYSDIPEDGILAKSKRVAD